MSHYLKYGKEAVKMPLNAVSTPLQFPMQFTIFETEQFTYICQLQEKS